MQQTGKKQHLAGLLMLSFTAIIWGAGFIIYRGFKIAKNSKDKFGFLLASGFTLVYGIQVVVNALVVSGAIPPTGLPLPLISSGNTSLIITMASMGVLYNVSRGD